MKIASLDHMIVTTKQT